MHMNTHAHEYTCMHTLVCTQTHHHDRKKLSRIYTDTIVYVYVYAKEIGVAGSLDRHVRASHTVPISPLIDLGDSCIPDASGIYGGSGGNRCDTSSIFVVAVSLQTGYNAIIPPVQLPPPATTNTVGRLQHHIPHAWHTCIHTTHVRYHGCLLLFQGQLNQRIAWSFVPSTARAPRPQTIGPGGTPERSCPINLKTWCMPVRGHWLQIQTTLGQFGGGIMTMCKARPHPPIFPLAYSPKVTGGARSGSGARSASIVSSFPPIALCTERRYTLSVSDTSSSTSTANGCPSTSSGHSPPSLSDATTTQSMSQPLSAPAQTPMP